MIGAAVGAEFTGFTTANLISRLEGKACGGQENGAGEA